MSDAFEQRQLERHWDFLVSRHPSISSECRDAIKPLLATGLFITAYRPGPYFQFVTNDRRIDVPPTKTLKWLMLNHLTRRFCFCERLSIIGGPEITFDFDTRGDFGIWLDTGGTRIWSNSASIFLFRVDAWLRKGIRRWNAKRSRKVLVVLRITESMPLVVRHFVASFLFGASSEAGGQANACFW